MPYLGCQYANAPLSGRLDGFFKPIPKTGEQIAAQKRKNDERLKAQKKKQKQENSAKREQRGKPKGTK